MFPNYDPPSPLCSLRLTMFRLFGIALNISFINHKNKIPYHKECVSCPNDHFKAVKNEKLANAHGGDGDGGGTPLW